MVGRRGRPGQPNQGPEREFLRAAYDAAGLRRAGQMWHVLRHSYASVLAAGGVRRDVVEQLMGHAGKGTTSIYTHLFRDAFEGVEEALDRVFGSTTRQPPAVSPQVTMAVSERLLRAGIPLCRRRPAVPDGRR